jgi:CRP-like cAMP-binding protein
MAHYFYLVRSGQVKLFRQSSKGDEKIIEIIQPGQTFAEAVMFLINRAYPVYAEALEPSQVLGFDMNTYLELLHESPKSCFGLMASMSQRLHSHVDEIDYLTQQNASFRLVYYLLQQIPDQEADRSIHLTTPKTVIASRLSIKPETLSRILTRLATQGLIEVHGNDITLSDLDGLKRYLHDDVQL